MTFVYSHGCLFSFKSIYCIFFKSSHFYVPFLQSLLKTFNVWELIFFSLKEVCFENSHHSPVMIRQVKNEMIFFQPSSDP